MGEIPNRPGFPIGDHLYQLREESVLSDTRGCRLLLLRPPYVLCDLMQGLVASVSYVGAACAIGIGLSFLAIVVGLWISLGFLFFVVLMFVTILTSVGIFLLLTSAVLSSIGLVTLSIYFVTKMTQATGTSLTRRFKKLQKDEDRPHVQGPPSPLQRQSSENKASMYSDSSDHTVAKSKSLPRVNGILAQ